MHPFPALLVAPVTRPAPTDGAAYLSSPASRKYLAAPGWKGITLGSVNVARVVTLASSRWPVLYFSIWVTIDLARS